MTDESDPDAGVAALLAVMNILPDGTRVQRAWFITADVAEKAVAHFTRTWGDAHVEGMVDAESSRSVGEMLLQSGGVTIVERDEEDDGDPG